MRLNGRQCTYTECDGTPTTQSPCIKVSQDNNKRRKPSHKHKHCDNGYSSSDARFNFPSFCQTISRIWHDVKFQYFVHFSTPFGFDIGTFLLSLCSCYCEQVQVCKSNRFKMSSRCCFPAINSKHSNK